MTEARWMQSVCPEGALPGSAVLEREIFVAVPADDAPVSPPTGAEPVPRWWRAAFRAAALIPASLGLLAAAGLVLVLVDANA